MPLPKIEVPEYNLTLHSTGETIVYRPFLVKEEKILLMALEGEDPEQILNAIQQIIENCILTDNVNVSQLPLFDLENIFLNIRSKSIGETSTISIPCISESCEAYTPHEINLEEIELKINENHQSKIQITDTIGVNMRYPSVGLIGRIEQLSEDDIEQSLEILTICIESIYDNKEEYDFNDYTSTEKTEFMEQLTQQQLLSVQEFFTTMPVLEYNLGFECGECGTKDLIPLRGLQNFFS
tara:strand:- start:4511 stop:5227 length:717 start_codon:yes stop_codon:yes gene_type:complete